MTEGDTPRKQLAHRPALALVTPALAAANNGNWQTAQRWARLLHGHYAVQVMGQWPPPQPTGPAPLGLIALHARRSADSVHRWRQAHPQGPLVVVLTGTDLYRDIAHDPSAQRSLALADALVVLNELGAQSVPAEHRAKVRVILQSTPSRKALPKTTRHLRALMVGHLREEKDPRAYFAAAEALLARSDIHLDHIGAPLDEALGQEAQALMARQPRYRWLGALPHAATLKRIQAAHVLVHASRMEGGAHVVIEAIACGTPVLASAIDGNLGLLGDGYPGTFAPGDAQALAALLQRCRDDAAMLPALQAACAARAALFAPAAEQRNLLALLSDCMHRP